MAYFWYHGWKDKKKLGLLKRGVLEFYYVKTLVPLRLRFLEIKMRKKIKNTIFMIYVTDKSISLESIFKERNQKRYLFKLSFYYHPVKNKMLYLINFQSFNTYNPNEVFLWWYSIVMIVLWIRSTVLYNI